MRIIYKIKTSENKNISDDDVKEEILELFKNSDFKQKYHPDTNLQVEVTEPTEEEYKLISEKQPSDNTNNEDDNANNEDDNANNGNNDVNTNSLNKKKRKNKLVENSSINQQKIYDGLKKLKESITDDINNKKKEIERQKKSEEQSLNQDNEENKENKVNNISTNKNFNNYQEQKRKEELTKELDELKKNLEYSRLEKIYLDLVHNSNNNEKNYSNYNLQLEIQATYIKELMDKTPNLKYEYTKLYNKFISLKVKALENSTIFKENILEFTKVYKLIENCIILDIFYSNLKMFLDDTLINNLHKSMDKISLVLNNQFYPWEFIFHQFLLEYPYSINNSDNKKDLIIYALICKALKVKTFTNYSIKLDTTSITYLKQLEKFYQLSIFSTIIQFYKDKSEDKKFKIIITDTGDITHFIIDIDKLKDKINNVEQFNIENDFIKLKLKDINKNDNTQIDMFLKYNTKINFKELSELFESNTSLFYIQKWLYETYCNKIANRDNMLQGSIFSNDTLSNPLENLSDADKKEIENKEKTKRKDDLREISNEKINKYINELEEKEAEAMTMEEIYNLSCSEPKNTIGAAQCMERKVLEIIKSSEKMKLKYISIKTDDKRHLCRFNGQDGYPLLFYKYPFFSQYNLFDNYSYFEQIFNLSQPDFKFVNDPEIHLWEYNKNNFKFYIISQIIQSAQSGTNATGAPRSVHTSLLFRPHMFVNDGEYGGLDCNRKAGQSGYLYLQDMNTGDVLHNKMYNYRTHDGQFSGPGEIIPELSPENDPFKLDEIDKVIFCYFHENCEERTDEMASLGKIFIGIYFLYGNKKHSTLGEGNDYHFQSCKLEQIERMVKDRCKITDI